MSTPDANHEGEKSKGLIASTVRFFLHSKLTVILVIASVLLGVAAIQLTPREEEPQIVVPMADIVVQAPGAGVEEVEKLITTPLERLLWQIDGVEYVYSISRRDTSMVTVRFFVGENREESLIKLHNAITKNAELVPGIVSGWAIKPVEIDDVPIVALTLYPSSDHPEISDFELRRVAEELSQRLAEVEDLSRISLVSGRSREIRVELYPERMAGLNVSPMNIVKALDGADQSAVAGTVLSGNREITISANSFLESAEDVRNLIVGVFDSKPVYLRDVAVIEDGPEEPSSYSRIGFSRLYLSRIEQDAEQPSLPAVTIALSKKKGSNAVDVSEAVLARLDQLRTTVLPAGIEVEITRDYGKTADAKVSDLLNSLGFAVFTVVLLLAFTLGWREAAIVALAVPVSFSLALFVNYMLGFTINRVTLFALILSLGLVVDDPITNVDNIQRHILMKKKKPAEATLDAVSEVLPPVIMSTLAIIVSFVPLFFITGMMGPYMAPMAANVPLTVIFSTICALTIVPWLAFRLLKDIKPKPGSELDSGPGKIERFYSWIITPFLESSVKRWMLLCGIVLGLVFSIALAGMRFVPLKMLPFDNKNEFQIVIDMDEGTPLEQTDRVVREFEQILRGVPEVTNFVTYAGEPSPMDFNGLVRHYYWRNGGHMADIRVNLADKSQRSEQSHAIVLRLRNELEAVAERNNGRIKIVESPPGPPVISTITTEVYGAEDRPYSALIEGADQIEGIMATESGVVDVDDSTEADRIMVDFVLDKEKAALHGVTARSVVATLQMALSGMVPATVHVEGERRPLPVKLILPRVRRSDAGTLSQIKVKTLDGKSVPLAELGELVEIDQQQPIYHKNLKRVVYVFAEMAGRAPGEAVLDMQSKLKADPLPPFIWSEWAGEGEWQITLDVFRDLGLAFAAALLGIYILLVVETGSFGMPLLIMSAIPLTLLGIMPGFWLLNLIGAGEVAGMVGEAFADPIFFTATSMIGMIALGGIVIRNSLVLIDFVRKSMAEGMELKTALIRSGAVRLRPIVLTAATTALGAWPITLDPIFSGLAWALIFGLLASTLFTLVVIPVGYYVFERD
ncbi:Multidrug efflux pump subunit AcrB [Maridesulfovibrio ferrireducens]|uniref:Multidrug efflux pump subunit AcrB n=1 Tax=Maridesulfovibrio ferrireducens TaxID=246191 RepID=A0A1G9B9G6_9BACT|nr:efflux RND transporter permease subunit [Maridesulfovibrio ferrireducens]SDK35505.1 Multidrug efflux pump subunit AcrB [Maridesulfovibrio ferrireducens]